jgi:hypothetical protein
VGGAFRAALGGGQIIMKTWAFLSEKRGWELTESLEKNKPPDL